MRPIRNTSQLKWFCFRWLSMYMMLLAWLLLPPLSSSAQVQGAAENLAVPKVLGDARSISVAPPLGALSESIPIVVSPGRRNVEPRLTLGYSSMAGLGDLGLGWQIDIGQVERWRGDGTPTVGDPDSFSYTLSGAGGQLINAGNGAYRARVESIYREFRRVAGTDGSCDTNPDTCAWVMFDGEGALHRFGGSAESRIDGQLWMLDLVQDPRGNTITYHYENVNGAIYIKEIRYTGFAPTGDPGANLVVFEYEDRPDARISYNHSVREERGRRLQRLSVFAGSALTRRYEFEYTQSPMGEEPATANGGVQEYGPSLLSRINLVGADDSSRIALRTLTYGTRPLGWASTPLLNSMPGSFFLIDSDSAQTGAQIMDVNGDGFADLIDNGANVWLGDGHGGFTGSVTWSAALQGVGVQFNTPSGNSKGADTGVRLADVNGDGLPDLLIAMPARQEVWLNTGQGWSKSGDWTLSLNAVQYPLKLGGSTFSVSFLADNFTVNTPYGYGGVELADVNGDGRPDIVWSYSCLDSSHCNWLVSIQAVYLNNGNGWTKDDALSSALASAMNGDYFGVVTDSRAYSMMDVNGDGIADIVHTLGDNNARAVYLGTGKGWVFDQGYTDGLYPPGHLPITSLDGGKGQGLVPMDLDGDGLIDFVRANETLTEAYRNTGNGWVYSDQLTRLIASYGVAFNTADGEATGVILADVDGDGIPDLIKAKNGESVEIWLSSSLAGNLLVQAKSSLGEVTDISWAPSSSFNNVRSDGVQGLPYSMPVVTGITRQDGRGGIFPTGYEYAGGLFQDRQFRGFAWSRESTPSKLRTETWYYQDEGIAGQMLEAKGYDQQGNLRLWKHTNLQKVQVTPLIQQVRLLQSDSQNLDPGGSRLSRVINTYDDRLRYVSVFRDPDIDVAGDETTTIFTWAQNDQVGIWTLPARTQTRAPDGTVVSESIILYDGLPEGGARQGLAMEARDLVTPGTYVTKKMEYDQYGNVVRVRDRAGNTTQFEYGDPTQSFRTRAVDPEGRTSGSAYDSRFGTLLKDEDASGNVSTYEYDAFGRRLRERLPGDEQSPFGTRTYTYSPLGDPLSQFFQVAETETAGQPGTLVTSRFFDGMGQIYWVQREAAGGRIAVSLTEFDDKGNAVLTSRPFFYGDNEPISYIVRDELHRPVGVIEPDGIELTMSYAGRHIDVVDRRGSKTSFYQNGDAKVTEVHRWVNGVEQVTYYRYDLFNHLTAIVDALGSQTLIYYDALGRRTRLDDPNAGTYKYQYDGEGRLISQVGPDGRTTTFLYNRSGDLLEKKFPDGTRNVFTYGGTGQRNAVGRVIRIEDAAGTVEMAYDARGNVIERRRLVEGRTYVTGYVYDSLKRIRRLTYPDGFTANYEYDSGGNFAQVTDGQGRMVAQGANFNAAGQYGEIAFGNGVRSLFAYDILLRMTSIRTATASGGTLQDLEYGYDPGGNVLMITDKGFGASQEFTYDGIGRLVQALGAYGEELYGYDAIGNLMSKGSLVFKVDPLHPQRVIWAEDTQPGMAKGEAFHIAYDARGNMIEKGDQRFQYDSENHLIGVRDAHGKVLVENVYDASGQRVIQRTLEGTTTFIDGIYEEDGHHVLRHVHAGSLLVATIAMPRDPVRMNREARDTSIADPFTDSRWYWLLTTLGGVGVFVMTVIPIPGRRNVLLRLLAGIAAIGSMLRLHPIKTLLIILLIPIHVLVFSDQALGGQSISYRTIDKREHHFDNRDHHSGTRHYYSEKRYYYHLNHLGSVNVVTDEQEKVVERRDYKPYGDPFNWIGPKSGSREFALTFDGQRYDDATGFYYFGARHYDPELGRFITADTQVPDPMNPQTLHRYAFAGGNPIRYVDPSGHSFWSWFLGILVIVALFVVGAILTIVTFGAAGPPIFIGLTLALAFLGGGVFASIALAHGLTPTSSDFWLAVAGGLALGAAVGAGLGALPAAITGGFLASVAASALLGAVGGGIETAIVHFKNGGSVETLFGALFSVDALISAGIGAGLGLIGGIGFGGVAGAAENVFSKIAIGFGNALVAGLGFWNVAYAAATGGGFMEDALHFGQFLGIFANSPPRSLGVPAWSLAGTWPGISGDSGGSETAGSLLTMPLAY